MLRSFAPTLIRLPTLPFRPNLRLPPLHAAAAAAAAAAITTTTTTSTSTSDSSFASYLATTYGLSPSAATAAAAKSRLNSPPRAEALHRLLRSHGFTSPQIARFFSKQPRFLDVADPDTTLAPKLSFLLGLGVSPKALASDPFVLQYSLKDRLRPTYTALAAALGSADVAAAVLQSSPRLLCYDLDEWLLPNLELLRQCGSLPPPGAVARAGVGAVDLRTLLSQALKSSPEKLAKTIQQLKEMQINPSSKMFVRVLSSLCMSRTSTRERKMAAYRSIGWSDAQTLSVFKRFPIGMLLSEAKIKKMAAFFQKELGWGPEVLTVYPTLLGLNLERRVVPRMAVWRLLALKELVSRGIRPNDLKKGNKSFLEKYVIKHVETHPEVLQAYRGNIGAAELLIASENSA